MYALRERRVHVTQEDFELAVAKVKMDISEGKHRIHGMYLLGYAKGFGKECFFEKTLEMIDRILLLLLSSNFFDPLFFVILFKEKHTLINQET